MKDHVPLIFIKPYIKVGRHSNKMWVRIPSSPQSHKGLSFILILKMCWVHVPVCILITFVICRLSWYTNLWHHGLCDKVDRIAPFKVNIWFPFLSNSEMIARWQYDNNSYLSTFKSRILISQLMFQYFLSDLDVLVFKRRGLCLNPYKINKTLRIVIHFKSQRFED